MGGAHVRQVMATGAFDDLRSPDVRFLQEAARLGPLHVRLWSDDLVAARCGKPPVFPEAERRFVVAALRYVAGVSVISSLDTICRPFRGGQPDVLAVRAADDEPALRAMSTRHGIEYMVPQAPALAGFPVTEPSPSAPDARRVIVTGCYDWLHSGHVQFFREAAAFGELYVVVGSDRNVRLLKGDGHPMHSEDERRYMVQAIDVVHQALVSTGSGWMDAEPEIDSIRPNVYLVNEDGDQPEKLEFCRTHGLEYVVLSRKPHPGLPRRTSTSLRGF